MPRAVTTARPGAQLPDVSPLASSVLIVLVTLLALTGTFVAIGSTSRTDRW